jgi:hypothetical protein
MRILEDVEWREWSDNEIARRCRVSNHLVAKARKDLTWNIPSERTYITKHGTKAKRQVDWNFRRARSFATTRVTKN